jgi:hypothetical protein
MLKKTEDINQDAAGAGKVAGPGEGERPAVVPGGYEGRPGRAGGSRETRDIPPREGERRGAKGGKSGSARESPVDLQDLIS